MEKLLFCYDGPIEMDENNQYYGNTINDEVLNRYQFISNDITIAIRVRKTTQSIVKKQFSKISNQKYKVVECPNVSSIKGILFDRKLCQKTLEKEIKKADYIIVRLPSIIGNMAISIARKNNKKYLVELVGCPWDSFWNHSLKGKIIAPIMTNITKRKVKMAPYVLYVTNNFLQKRYPTNGKNIGCSDVVLNNIDEEILSARQQFIRDREKLEPKIIMTTAAVDVKYKGQEYVIEALADLKKCGLNYEYWLVGSGDENYLKTIAKKYNLEKEVKFLGSLPHEEIFKKLKQIDIYIQPSKQEGLPRALIEAMSMGCLCIGADVGGIPELLDKEFIFKIGDSKEISKKIKNITINEMLQQSRLNFNKSKEYQKDILKEKREKFYREFI